MPHTRAIATPLLANQRKPTGPKTLTLLAALISSALERAVLLSLLSPLYPPLLALCSLRPISSIQQSDIGHLGSFPRLYKRGLELMLFPLSIV